MKTTDDLEKFKQCLDDIGIKYDVYEDEHAGRFNLVSQNNYCDKIDVYFGPDDPLVNND